MKIGIVTSTIREGRKSIEVAKWVEGLANKRNDAGVTYEIVDIKDYNIPVLGAELTAEDQANIGKFSQAIAGLDAYVFVVAEYNHSPSGAMKNALDYLKPELANKVAGYVGYGGVGAARAIEQLRLVNAEQAVATVQRNVNLLLAYDFKNFTEFTPQDYQVQPLNELLDQVILWGKALKTVR